MKESLITTEHGSYSVKFIETVLVSDGVSCDVYKIIDNPLQDIAVIHIQKWKKTPRQKVLEWEKTIEWYLTGSGKLVIENDHGDIMEYAVWGKNFQREVERGEIMQWQAENDSDLVVYELCTPPYADGRFLNLE